MPFIPKLIAAGYVSPAFGRFIEIGIYSVLAAVLSVAADSLSAWQLPALNSIVTVAVTAALAYFGKAARDAAKESDNAAK